MPIPNKSEEGLGCAFVKSAWDYFLPPLPRKAESPFPHGVLATHFGDWAVFSLNLIEFSFLEGACCDGFFGPTALSRLCWSWPVVVMPGTHLQPFPSVHRAPTLHCTITLFWREQSGLCPAAEVPEWIQVSGEMGARCYSSYCPLLQRCLQISATFLIESALEKSPQCVWCPEALVALYLKM